jgi:hypothetical protein
MTNQPFPALNSKITAADGTITPVWRAFFQTLWDRGGGVIGTAFAALNGNAAQKFKVANATVATEAVSLGQAGALYQPVGSYAALAGSAAQKFKVADAVAVTEATSLQQTTALIAAAVAPLVTTVAALPASTAGARAFVTNALAPVFAAAVAGGGAVVVPVYHDGTIWRVG